MLAVPMPNFSTVQAFKQKQKRKTHTQRAVDVAAASAWYAGRGCCFKRLAMQGPLYSCDYPIQ